MNTWDVTTAGGVVAVTGFEAEVLSNGTLVIRSKPGKLFDAFASGEWTQVKRTA